MLRKCASDLFNLSSPQFSKNILKHTTILGFGRITLSDLSNEKVSIDAVLAPIVDGKRCLDGAERLSINISNLGFLASRMQILNGVLRGREVKNQYSLRVDLPSNLKPELVKLADLPFDKLWYADPFKEKFSDLLNSNYITTQAIRLDNNSEVTIYVPCSEILRFYYPSTSLVEAAFSGREAGKSLFVPNSIDHAENRSLVTLRKKIPDICAPHVGRIQFSKYAEVVFNRIYTDSIHRIPMQSKDDRFLVAYPPIQGQTDWVVEATELDNSSLIVSGIYKCGGAFPFDELLFGRENDGRSPRGREKPDYTTYRPTKKPIFSNLSSSDNPSPMTTISLDGVAEPQIETLNLEFDFESDTPNFDALSNMSVKKIDKAAVKNPEEMNVRVYIGEEAVQGVVSAGFLRNENKDKFAKAEISMGTVKKSQLDKNRKNAIAVDAFYAFQNAINSLETEFNISWRKASAWRIPTKASFYLNAFLPKEIGDNEFLMHGKREYENSLPNDKFTLSRKFVIAEVSCEERYIYFVDFEKKKSTSRDGNNVRTDNTSILFFYDINGEYLTNYQLKKIIYEFSINRSGWPNKRTRFKVQHSSNPTAFQTRLLKKSRAAFDFWET